MRDIGISMIRDSLTSIVSMNPEIARTVIIRDNEIDNLNVQVFRELLQIIMESPAKTTDALQLITVSRALERIGDHATNIAERAVYYVEGVDIRHATTAN